MKRSGSCTGEELLKRMSGEGTLLARLTQLLAQLGSTASLSPQTGLTYAGLASPARCILIAKALEPCQIESKTIRF